MRLLKIISLLAIFLAFFSCKNNDNNSNVVSQKFVHKYGFDLSETEWQKRSKSGISITTLENGVTLTKTYNDNVLHGPTTYSYPNSSIIERTLIYDNNTLVKQTFNDKNSIPYKQEVYEPVSKKIITLWDKSGVPISIEEYEGEELIDGKYFRPDNELEASIENGSGYRFKRDREGELLYKEKFENGMLLNRTTYHSNGKVKSTMSFKNYVLHGDQINYTPSGQVLMTMTWKDGNLDGTHLIYEKGTKIAEIPYNNGLKNGIERHFDTSGQLVSETHWELDKKHGSERVYKDNDTEIKWFYKGKAVSIKRFEDFCFREKLVANKDQFFNMVEEMDTKTALEE